MLKRLAVFLLVILSQLFAQVRLTEDEQHWLDSVDTITLGVDKYYIPLNFENRSGVMDGMNIDFLHLIEEKIGKKFVLDSGHWADVLPRALDYKNDGIINADKSSDKEGALLFTESFVHHPLGLFTHVDREKVSSLSALDSMTIAIKKHTSTIDYIKRVYPKAQIIEVKDNAEALQMVSEKKVDGAIDFYSVLNSLMKKHNIGYLQANRIFYADQIGMSRIGIRKDAPLLVSLINKAILDMDLDERAEIITKWIDNRSIARKMNTRLKLTDNEKEWLLAHPHIKVGYLKDWAPMQFYDVDGNPMGLTKEYIDYLDSLLPISFDIVPLPESPEERLRKIDLIPAVTVTRTRKKMMDFTESYLELPVYIFTHLSHPYVGDIEPFRGKRVAVRDGFAAEEWLRENYPDITVVPVRTTIDGLRTLKRGDADAFVGNPFVIGYAIEEGHFHNVHAVGEIEFVYKQTMGVRKELAPLIPIINKTLKSMTPEQKEAYFRKHMSFVYERHIDTTPFLQVGGGLLFVIIIILYWNRRLASEVKNRKKAEGTTQQTIEMLRESEQKFKTFFESVEDAIFIHDLKGRFLEVNRLACNRLGYSFDEFMELSFQDIDVPMEGLDPKEAMEKLMHEKKLLIEGCHRTKEGEPIPVEISAQLITYNGEPAVMSLVRDIRDRKKREEELQEYSEKLSLALESSNAGIWKYDLVTGDLEWDDRMFELYGINRSNFSSAYAAWESALHPDDVKRGNREIEDAISGVKDFNTDFRVVWPSGEVRIIEAHALVKRNSEGKPLCMVGVNFDITQKRLQEQQLIESESNLRDAKERAENALRSKSDFLDNISHEIRTPLNAVTGFSELLEGMVTDDKQKRYLSSIKMAGKTLLRLINDVLDLSKMEAGRMQIQFELFSLKTLFTEMKQIFSLKAEENSIDLTFTCDEQIGAIKLDEIRIRQILLNLVGNALKFTNQGEIKVTAVLEKDKTGDALLISIEDTGIGIPKKDQERIFDDFEQQEGHDRKLYGGTGLGLAISKRLVEMQGGTISVESTVGVGSKFILTFPDIEWTDSLFVDSDSLTLREANEFQFDDKMVWIVDDVESNLLLLEELLINRGLHCKSFINGKELLTALEEYTPDLIITDLRMPVMGGEEMTQKIRNGEKSSIPIIALTASTKEENIKECRTLFNGFLRKPIEVEHLYAKIKEFIKTIGDEVEEKPVVVKPILPNTLQYLREQFAPQLETLKGAMTIESVKELGEDLMNAVIDSGDEAVIIYAQSILDAADSFDIKAIIGLPQKLSELLGE